MQALFPNCTQKSNHNVIYIAIVAGGFFGHIQPWEIHVSFARRRLNTWSPPQRLNEPRAELPATARPPKQRHGPRHGRHGSNALRSKQKLHWHEWSKDSKDSKAPNGSAKSWTLICFWSASVWVFFHALGTSFESSESSVAWTGWLDSFGCDAFSSFSESNRRERQHCTKQIAPYCLRWIRDLCAVERVLGQPKGAGLIWWLQQEVSKGIASESVRNPKIHPSAKHLP